MKITDLMIGDWVIIDHPTIGKQAERVIHLEEDCLMTNDTYTTLDVEPVLLTAEILEKNGFDVSDGEVMRYNFEEDGQSFHFSLRQMYDKEDKPNGYSFYAFNVLTIIDFVHELQHALKLCGIGKTIEL